MEWSCCWRATQFKRTNSKEWRIKRGSFPRVMAVAAVHGTNLLGKPNSWTLLKISLFSKVFRPPKQIKIWIEVYWAFRNWCSFGIRVISWRGDSITSDLEAIKCAAFNPFMRGATPLWIYPPSGLKMAKNPVQNANKQHVRGR